MSIDESQATAPDTAAPNPAGYTVDDFFNQHQKIGGEPKSLEEIIRDHQVIGGEPKSLEQILIEHTKIGCGSL